MNMFKVNTLLRLSNVHQTIKLSAEKSSLQQRLLSGIIEAFILTKENKGTGMERWKGGTDWERDSHCGFACDQTLRKLVLLCMQTCADHTESLQNHEPEARQPLRVSLTVPGCSVTRSYP